MKNKNGQAAAIVLIVIAIVLITALLVFVLVTWLPSSKSEKVDYDTESVRQQALEPQCPAPYIKVGPTCCLDSNYNRICDNDEEQEEEEEVERCSYPYLQRGDTCCLDKNRNRICDMFERSRDGKADGDLDHPFDLDDIDINDDEIELEIENKDDVDYIIVNIDISGCDDEDFDDILEAGEKETFDIECDDARDRRERDIDLYYSDIDGNETFEADGEIEYDRDYYDDYDPYYDEHY